MPKVKPARKGVHTDMTAMCDVAFLLLTFFILTTSFKPDEPVVVDTPSAITEVKVPKIDVLQVMVSEEGKVFFSIDGVEHRRNVLLAMGASYGVSFTESEVELFSIMGAFGLNMNELKAYLSAKVKEDHDALERIEQNGIPIGEGQTELNNWILKSRMENPKYVITLKGDVDMDYGVTARVIEIFKGQNLNKFNLITNLEAAPSEDNH